MWGASAPNAWTHHVYPNLERVEPIETCTHVPNRKTRDHLDGLIIAFTNGFYRGCFQGEGLGIEQVHSMRNVYALVLLRYGPADSAKARLGSLPVRLATATSSDLLNCQHQWN